MTITDSLFTNGTSSLIHGNLAIIEMRNVTFYNSTDFSSYGHAFLCSLCYDVQIYNSTFRHLSALEGGAIYIDKFQGTSQM